MSKNWSAAVLLSPSSRHRHNLVLSILNPAGNLIIIFEIKLLVTGPRPPVKLVKCAASSFSGISSALSGILVANSFSMSASTSFCIVLFPPASPRIVACSLTSSSRLRLHLMVTSILSASIALHPSSLAISRSTEWLTRSYDVAAPSGPGGLDQRLVVLRFHERMHQLSLLQLAPLE